MRILKNVDQTYGDPQRVSAIIALGSERAKPKSATLRMGTPRGWPLASSSGGAGLRRRFYNIVNNHVMSGYGYIPAV